MASKIKLIFLGTSDSVPSAKRNHTGILLVYKGENFLIDCGEGTQRQFRIAGLNPCKITKILITHIHGDHVLGLPGLMETLSLNGYNKSLDIYGPKGTKNFIKKLLELFNFYKNYKINVFEVSKGKFIDEGDFYFECLEVNHGIPCNAYNFVRKEQLRIDKKKLEKSGIKEGAFLKNIKQGKNIAVNGKKYYFKDLTFKEKSKKISFVLDTRYNKKIIGFVKNADILVSESCFSKEDSNKAEERMHLTSEQAGKIAKNSKSGKLILTHISQRYFDGTNNLLEEAKKEFKNTFIARDFDEFELE